MSSRRALSDTLSRASPERLSPEARRIEAARAKKVSVWPPAWMAGQQQPNTAEQIAHEPVADVEIVMPAAVTLPKAPRSGVVRFGRMPARWNEALLASSLALGLFAFALVAINSVQWSRTEVAGIPVDLVEEIGPQRPGRAVPLQPRSAAPETDPFWPTPPAHRAIPVEPEPTEKAPRRLTTEPSTRSLIFRPER
jgi:hypothetical protein